MGTKTLEQHESQVRTYCRRFPVEFDKAEGAHLFGTDGRCYIDFLAGAGSLNYGHNNPAIREAIIDYLNEGGIVQSLDLYTVAKREFVRSFVDKILTPRGMADYKLQFVGPTGTNAVEAALKLARKVTGSTEIFAFTDGFHGVSLGALATCGEHSKRAAGGVPLNNVTRVPFEGFHGNLDTIAFVERMLDDPNSGWVPPAAFIVEIVQGEGGLNVASSAWLQALERLCRKMGSILIVDEVQTGCGRTGDFFAFEASGIRPDIICVSKSIGGYGLPMALVLLRPELDCWRPGEHNGTFRGSCLSFVAATRAIDTYWSDAAFIEEVRKKAVLMRARLNELQDSNRGVSVVGRGMMLGLRFHESALAGEVSALCFENGLIAETCGPHGNTLKFLPPLTTPPEVLLEGLEILAAATSKILRQRLTVSPTSGVLESV